MLCSFWIYNLSNYNYHIKYSIYSVCIILCIFLPSRFENSLGLSFLYGCNCLSFCRGRCRIPNGGLWILEGSYLLGSPNFLSDLHFSASSWGPLCPKWFDFSILLDVYLTDERSLYFERCLECFESSHVVSDWHFGTQKVVLNWYFVGVDSAEVQGTWAFFHDLWKI